MRLLLIRHGDPDCEIDSLTTQGWAEADALSRYLEHIPVTEYYTSPLGRARDTASLTLKRAGREATVLPWLTEFTHRTPLKPDYPDSTDVPWDWRPIHWTHRDEFFDKDAWAHAPELADANIAHHHREVCRHFDEFLSEKGYTRNGRLYHTEQGTSDTYVFFCHLGLIGILLSHLLHISPMLQWHTMCAAPSSITTVVTEERTKGYASMRMLSFGATPHLHAAGLEPSFAARFCETYEMSDQRH